MNFLKINGEHGEGGGQIIRSAITLSCITKQPIHLENIRKNRKVIGLRPQHLTAIKIIQKITNAEVIGAEVGSTELKFIPGNVKSLELIEDVGTAGSISLILQVLIPVVAISQKKLDLKIKGGTDVLWSPSIDYTQYVLREAYSRMGIKFSLELCKRGYYPKGGGEINLHVNPSNLKLISFTKRKTNSVKLICTYSKISIEKIKNEVKEIKQKLTKENFIVETEIKNEEATDSGASMLIYSIDEHSIIGIDALFDKKTQKFDCVVTDVNMPNKDGITLIKDLRALPNYKFVPMLMLTTESGMDKKQQGKAAGATGWIVKPFNPDQLLKTIKKVLG